MKTYVDYIKENHKQIKERDYTDQDIENIKPPKRNVKQYTIKFFNQNKL